MGRMRGIIRNEWLAGFLPIYLEGKNTLIDQRKNLIPSSAIQAEAKHSC